MLSVWAEYEGSFEMEERYNERMLPCLSLLITIACFMDLFYIRSSLRLASMNHLTEKGDRSNLFLSGTLQELHEPILCSHW